MECWKIQKLDLKKHYFLDFVQNNFLLLINKENCKIQFVENLTEKINVNMVVKNKYRFEKLKNFLIENKTWEEMQQYLKFD